MTRNIDFLNQLLQAHGRSSGLPKWLLYIDSEHLHRELRQIILIDGCSNGLIRSLASMPWSELNSELSPGYRHRAHGFNKMRRRSDFPETERHKAHQSNAEQRSAGSQYGSEGNNDYRSKPKKSKPHKKSSNPHLDQSKVIQFPAKDSVQNPKIVESEEDLKTWAQESGLENLVDPKGPASKGKPDEVKTRVPKWVVGLVLFNTAMSALSLLIVLVNTYQK